MGPFDKLLEGYGSQSPIELVYYMSLAKTESVIFCEPWKASTVLFYTPQIPIFHQTESFKKTDLSSLLAIIAGGAATKTELQLQFEESFKKYHPGRIPPFIKQWVYSGPGFHGRPGTDRQSVTRFWGCLILKILKKNLEFIRPQNAG